MLVLSSAGHAVRASAAPGGPEGADGAERRVIFRPHYGVSFVNPKDANAELDRINTATNPAGANNNFKLPALKSVWGWNAFLGYQLTPEVAIGPDFLTVSGDGASATQDGATKYSYDAGIDTLMMRLYYSLYDMNDLRIELSPGIGLGMFSISSTANTNNTATFTANGLAAKGAAVFSYQFTPAFGLELEGGYMYAKSAALKVDSQNGTAYTTGQIVTWNGKEAKLDMSGPFIMGGLVFRFGVPHKNEIPGAPGSPSSSNSASSTSSTSAAHESSVTTPSPVRRAVKKEPIHEGDEIENQLKRLDRLRKSGVITEEEYKLKRKELLDQIK